MLNVIFNDSDTIYKASFSITENVIKLIGNIPKNTSGFILLTENGVFLGDYPTYTTIYQEFNNGYEFSDDGTVYVPPIIPEPVVIVEPTEEELEQQEKQSKITNLINQIAAIDSEFSELDYIGIKIATGRTTADEYKTEIAKMEELAIEKDSLLEQLKVFEVV